VFGQLILKTDSPTGQAVKQLMSRSGVGVNESVRD